MSATLTMPALGSRAIAALTGWRHGDVCRMIQQLHRDGRFATPLWGRRYRDGSRRRGTEYLLGRQALRQFLHDIDCGAAAQALRLWLTEVEAMQGPGREQAVTVSKGEKFLPRYMGIPLKEGRNELDAYGAARGYLTVPQVFRLLDTTETRFVDFLIEHQVVVRANGILVPQVKHLKGGRMVMRSGIGAAGHQVHTSFSFTPRGVDWIVALWRDRAGSTIRSVA